MFTTAAVARRAASLYDRIDAVRTEAGWVATAESGAGSAAGPVVDGGWADGGAGRTAGSVGALGALGASRWGSHSGRSVANVNISASTTVTACAKTNQSFLSMSRGRGKERRARDSAAAAVTAAELSACFEEVLGASRFSDYSPNGLQVEGERPIRRLLSGV